MPANGRWDFIRRLKVKPTFPQIYEILVHDSVFFQPCQKGILYTPKLVLIHLVVKMLIREADTFPDGIATTSLFFFKVGTYLYRYPVP